jgi:hypothetical protein
MSATRSNTISNSNTISISNTNNSPWDLLMQRRVNNNEVNNDIYINDREHNNDINNDIINNINIGRDEGSAGLGPKLHYQNCVVAEYVWCDAFGVPRSKAKTLTHIPTEPEDLPVWNFDGSSTEQATGSDSDVFLIPRAIFKDPFRGGHHVMVLAECCDSCKTSGG